MNTHSPAARRVHGSVDAAWLGRSDQVTLGADPGQRPARRAFRQAAECYSVAASGLPVHGQVAAARGGGVMAEASMRRHTAIVTGANHGIGAATALVLGRRGCAVLCCFLRIDDAADPGTPQAYRTAAGKTLFLSPPRSGPPAAGHGRGG
jgi:hypothetical protein